MSTKYFQLDDLALLFLAMAQTEDVSVGNRALEAVTDSLSAHYPKLDRNEVQIVVLEVMTAHLDKAALRQASYAVIHSLGAELTLPQKTAILRDLERIARADGVVFEEERSLLLDVAAAWQVDEPGVSGIEAEGAEDAGVPSWGALHHLAFIYLVLAHGTDHEFSDEERALVLRKLQEWAPELTAEEVRQVLERAMARYAKDAGTVAFDASVQAVRTSCSKVQRRSAFSDLVQVANVDGVFLDSEEDLLNALSTAWDLDVR